MEKEEKTFCKEQSADIYTNSFHSKLLKYTAEKIRKFYSSGNCLVCGPSIKGEIEKELPTYYNRIICVDKSEDILNAFRDNIKSDKFELMENNLEAFDLENLGNIKFDTILALHILEHLENPINFLKIMKSLLTNDGKIIIVVPNSESLHRCLGVKMGIIKTIYDLGEEDLRVGHKRIYNIYSLNMVRIKSGLKIHDIGGILLKPFNNTLMETLPIDVLNGLNKMSDEFDYNCADILMVAK